MRAAATALTLASLLGHAAAQGVDDRPERRVRSQELQGRINDAILAGTLYLTRVQNEDGSWTYDRTDLGGGRPSAGGAENGLTDYSGGLTALALYALAASGLPAENPTAQKGLEWVEGHPHAFSADSSKGVYSTSLLILALTRIDADRHRRKIHGLAALLVDSQHRDGMWSYYLDRNRTIPTGAAPVGRMTLDQLPPVFPGDNSNTQFAVLALWAAQELAGYRVPRKAWERVAALYQRTQQSTGGWTYRDPEAKTGVPPGEVTLSMTAAGLVSHVYATAALGGGIEGLAAARRTPVATRGLSHFLAERKSWSRANYYAIYSIERVGTVLDVPTFVWYQDGAERLVQRQHDDGSWSLGNVAGALGGHGDSRHVYETALALLFLSRATVYPITPARNR